MIGKTLGRYQILKELGSGGMGQVFLAQDPQESRVVALKILPKELAFDPQRLKRFLRESRIAAAIQHANVAQIYEIGEADSVRFISMEYLNGETLDVRLGGGPLPVSQVIEMGLEIAAGLGAAHAGGIVHRDIKPGNIMLMPDGKVKILDFGLAKIHERKTDDVSSLKTDIGTAVGTVNYMSPEQVMGVSLDYRSDIFSLGVVLYEALTGTPPFHSKNLYATVELIIQSQPAPISSLVPGVPVQLEQVISRCMEKEPKNRFQSAGEVIDDLDVARTFVVSPVVSLPEINQPSVLPEKKERSKRSYVEMGITLFVFLSLCVYLLRSCH